MITVLPSHRYGLEKVKHRCQAKVVSLRYVTTVLVQRSQEAIDAHLRISYLILNLKRSRLPFIRRGSDGSERNKIWLLQCPYLESRCSQFI